MILQVPERACRFRLEGENAFELQAPSLDGHLRNIETRGFGVWGLRVKGFRGLRV